MVHELFLQASSPFLKASSEQSKRAIESLEQNRIIKTPELPRGNADRAAMAHGADQLAH